MFKLPFKDKMWFTLRNLTVWYFLFSFNKHKCTLAGWRACGHMYCIEFMSGLFPRWVKPLTWSLSYFSSPLTFKVIYFTISILMSVSIYMWWEAREEGCILNNTLPCMGAVRKVPFLIFMQTLCDYIYNLSTDKKKSILDNDIQVLNFQLGPKRERLIVFFVLCFQRTWMCLHYFHLCCLVIIFLISQ